MQLLPEYGDAPQIGRDDDKTDETEPHGGVQGESGLGGVKDDKTLSKLAKIFDLHPNQITD